MLRVHACNYSSEFIWNSVLARDRCHVHSVFFGGSNENSNTFNEIKVHAESGNKGLSNCSNAVAFTLKINFKMDFEDKVKANFANPERIWYEAMRPRYESARVPRRRSAEGAHGTKHWINMTLCIK